MFDSEMKVTVVQAFVHHRGQVLCVRRRNWGDTWRGAYQPFGGRVEAGETPEEALHRELREEYGPDFPSRLKSCPEAVTAVEYYDNGKDVIAQVFIRLPESREIPRFAPESPEGTLEFLDWNAVRRMAPLNNHREWRTAGVPEGTMAAFADAICAFWQALKLYSEAPRAAVGF